MRVTELTREPDGFEVAAIRSIALTSPTSTATTSDARRGIGERPRRRSPERAIERGNRVEVVVDGDRASHGAPFVAGVRGQDETECRRIHRDDIGHASRLLHHNLPMSTSASPVDVAKASWFPLAIVMLCQIQVSFNAFNVSIEGIVEDLGIPATSVGLALTTSTFAMAGFVLLGARVGAKIGPRKALHIGMIGPTVAAITISLTNQGWMLFAVQALNGATVALAAPALTVVIASNYHGRQQGQAIGFLASAIPLAQVVSLLLAGALASSVGWRWSFVLLSVIGIVNLLLIGRLAPIDRAPRGRDRLARRRVVVGRHHPGVGSVQLPERVGVLPGHRSGAVRRRRALPGPVPADRSASC